MDVKLLFPDEAVEGNRHGDNGTRSSLMSVDTALGFMEAAVQSKKTVSVQSFDDLGLEFHERDDASQNLLGMHGDLVLRPPQLKGTDLEVIPFSDMGMRTACAQIGIPYSFFRNRLSTDERFGKFRSLMRGVFNKVHKEGFQLRVGSDSLGNAEVDALLERNWNPTSDHEIVARTVETIRGYHGSDAVAGIEAITGDRKGNLGYRIVMDEPIIDDGASSSYSTFPMFSYLSNEYGLQDAKMDFGLWQVVCWNGMLTAIEHSAARWSHRGEGSEQGFYDKIRDMSMLMQHYIPIMAETVTRSRQVELPGDPKSITSHLLNMDAISKPHADAIEHRLEFETVSSEWDYISVMTDTAKGINPLNKRQKAENDASRIAHWDGGIENLLGERHLSKIAKNRPFGEDGAFQAMAVAGRVDAANA